MIVLSVHPHLDKYGLCWRIWHRWWKNTIVFFGFFLVSFESVNNVFMSTCTSILPLIMTNQEISRWIICFGILPCLYITSCSLCKCPCWYTTHVVTEISDTITVVQERLGPLSGLSGITYSWPGGDCIAHRTCWIYSYHTLTHTQAGVSLMKPT